MAFSNIDANTIQLGKLLQIAYSNGVRNQISQDYRDWEFINRARIGKTAARQLNFMLQTSYGPSAIQYRNPGTTGRSFPLAQQSTVSEHSAYFKELNGTIELEYNMWDRARKSPEKYAEPLALEIMAKTTASKRRLAADLYGDGTGVVGTVASAAVTSPTSNKLIFTLASTDAARGSVGQFEFDDILVLTAADGSASALNTSLATEPVYWKVVAKNRAAGTVTLMGLDSSYAPVATISSITTGPTAGDVFYRYGQPTIGDLTGSISDYGTFTEVMAGLESLAANDGRVIHGITMTGSTAGSRYDAGAAAFDTTHIQAAMDAMKIAVGADAYRWKLMAMAPEAQSALIESREDDRRFQTVEDNKRGVKFFAYVHGSDVLECYNSEFVSKKRVYILPEAKSGGKVLEFYGSDFETVKGQGMSDFHLKPGASGGHVNTVVSYLQAIGVLVCKHPAAIGTIHNFTV